MKTDDYTFKKESDDFKVTDVKPKIKEFIKNMILIALKDNREINWKDLTTYCHLFGSIDAPNILTVPICVIDEVLKELELEYK